MIYMNTVIRNWRYLVKVRIENLNKNCSME